MAKKKKTAEESPEPVQLPPTDLPTDPAVLCELQQMVFARTILKNPFMPIIYPEKNDDGTYKTDERTGRPKYGRPSPKQTEALAYLGLEMLYGGSAGGGKSDFLLMAAAQFVEVPGYSAIIFRRSLKMLEKSGGLIPRSLEWGWAQKGARYNYTDRRWTFPSGATVEFGYIDTKKDLENYQGGNWQTVCFDEAGQMDPEHLRYLFSRLRKPEGSQLPIRMRLAANPGGKSHEYLKKRFVVPGAEGFFVPSRLEDNPGLNISEYTRSLAELDPILRAQLLAGDWSAYEGGRFKKAWFKEFYVSAPNNIPSYFLEIGKDKYTQSPKFAEEGIPIRDCVIIIIIDPACTEDDTNCPTAWGVYAITPTREILKLDGIRKFLDIDDIVPETAQLCVKYHPIWVGVEDAGSFKMLSRAMSRHPSIPAVKSISHESKSKLVRAIPAIIRTEAGQVYLPPEGPKHPWVEEFVSECIRFTGDEEQDAFTDQVDEFAHLVRMSDRMGMGGAQVIYRDQPEPEVKGITFLRDDGHGQVDGKEPVDEWDDEPLDQASQTKGGLIGWRR